MCNIMPLETNKSDVCVREPALIIPDPQTRSLPISRNLLLVIARDLQEIRRSLPLQVPSPIVQRQPLICGILTGGLLICERIRPSLLWHLSRVRLLHVSILHHACRGLGIDMDDSGSELRSFELNLKLLVLQFGLLPYLWGKRGVVEHDRDLTDLRLEVGNRVCDVLRVVIVIARLHISVIFLLLCEIRR